jgi:hypothetical protein
MEVWRLSQRRAKVPAGGEQEIQGSRIVREVYQVATVHLTPPSFCLIDDRHTLSASHSSQEAEARVLPNERSTTSPSAILYCTHERAQDPLILPHRRNAKRDNRSANGKDPRSVQCNPSHISAVQYSSQCMYIQYIIALSQPVARYPRPFPSTIWE